MLGPPIDQLPLREANLSNEDPGPAVLLTTKGIIDMHHQECAFFVITTQATEMLQRHVVSDACEL